MANTFQEYKDAVVSWANNTAEWTRLTAGKAVSTVTAAKSLVDGYAAYTKSKEGRDGEVVLSLEKWMQQDDTGKALVIATGADKDNAIALATEYYNADAKIKSTMETVAADGKLAFEKAKGFLEGNWMALIAGLAPLLLHVSGAIGEGIGLIGSLLLGAVAFLAVGALTDENSPGGQALGWIKENVMGIHPKGLSKNPELPAAGTVVPLQNVEAADTHKLAGTTQFIDLRVPNEDATARIYGKIEGDKFIAAGARYFNAHNPTLIDTKSFIPPITLSGVTTANGKIALNLTAENLTAIKAPMEHIVTQHFAEVAANKAHAESDFITGKYKISTVQSDQDVTITAASTTDPDVARTYKGTMAADGSLTINKIMEMPKDETDQRKAVAVDLATPIKIDGVGQNMTASGSHQQLDQDKLLTDPTKKSKLDGLIKSFGIDDGKQADDVKNVYDLLNPATTPAPLKTGGTFTVGHGIH